MSDCVFCQIVAGTAPSHKVLEDAEHVAFLSIFPNTPGFTVAIPKQHMDADVLSLDDEAYTKLLLFAKRVDAQLRRGLGVDRCALAVEGLMINHAHAKLIPLHGLNGRTYVVSEGTVYSDQYRGFITTNEGPRCADEQLAVIAQQIRDANA
ncbi:hypothetical protein LPJ64_000445 [Coemansia asiatica]|uniref:HIT domain-containing protein n=1 Tax=Coemansia asiatica TaxID=1052880 RepID=A0A9W7XN30_9FUNG|nr:hypothetical protein LPJ64_000445 [Coemansia asiatica]KAJ2883845.1 hypothetical protein FB639_002083 [Coemansia asiatica]